MSLKAGPGVRVAVCNIAHVVRKWKLDPKGQRGGSSVGRLPYGVGKLGNVRAYKRRTGVRREMGGMEAD